MLWSPHGSATGEVAQMVEQRIQRLRYQPRRRKANAACDYIENPRVAVFESCPPHHGVAKYG